MPPSLSPGASAPPLRAAGNGEWGTFVYGTSRPLVAWFAHALSAACDPEPVWVDFRNEGAGPDPACPIAVGAIPPERLYVVMKSEGRPEASLPPGTLWTIVRSDEPEEKLAELSDFVRLPSRVQEVVGLRGGTGPRRAFVVANTDRVREYYPGTIPGIRPFVLTALRANLLPIFTSLPPRDPGYLALDHVFEVRARSLADWREGTLYCEQAPAGSEFAARTTFHLGSLPELTAVLGTRQF